MSTEMPEKEEVSLPREVMLAHRLVRTDHLLPEAEWMLEPDPHQVQAAKKRAETKTSGKSALLVAIAKGRKARATLPAPSAHAYKPLKKGAVVQDRHEALHRQVQSLLNKIAPDNLQVICFKLADIQISNAEELQFVIEIIFKKALSESHYCSTYADMMTVLGHCYPEFPAETEGGSPRSFTRMLLTTVQSEYESFPKTLEPTPEMVASAASSEDLATLVLQVKKKMLANMKLMGHLFLRKLISLKIVQSTVSALLAPVGAHDPEEHLVECVIEIMTCVGFTLEESAAEGQQFLRLTTERLRVLRANKSYSTRCRLLILDYLDLVEAKWKKKVYTEGAKKVSEVHKAARRNAFNKQAFSFEIAGAAPANLTELENLKPVPKAKPKPKSAPKPPGDGPKPCFGVDLCRSFLLGRCNRGTKCRFRMLRRRCSGIATTATRSLKSPWTCTRISHLMTRSWYDYWATMRRTTTMKLSS
mmetsp:Transcript_29696/g.67316  ORF Transcript_29696/g.67316 Transcript_29696/m.67316 type:complete len:474 (-) Transcript_29696:519-1940(-)